MKMWSKRTISTILACVLSAADSVGVIQRTTIRTNEAIATATAKLYK